MEAILKAKDIMTTKVLTLKADMIVGDAAIKLVKKGVFAAPVLAEDGFFVGMFSLQGCMNALGDLIYHEVPFPIHVRDYLEPHRHTHAISENARLFSIAHIFAHSEQLVISLPVLRHRKVVGIVARQDVIRAVLKLMAKIPQPREATLYLSGLEKERHEIAKLR